MSTIMRATSTRPRYPLRAAPSGRYLVDQDGVPVFVHGDTVWSMAVSAIPDEWETYLADRAARGFTAIIVNAIERLFTADPPRTLDGLEPFTSPGDLATPNETYFARIDTLLEAAARHGLEVYLAPLYLGYIDPHPQYPGFASGVRPEGWHAEVVASDVDKLRSYGRYVGRRWRRFDNLTWVIGGDRNPGDVIEHMRAFVGGIVEEDDRHLATAHVHPDDSSVLQYEGDTWLTLNQTYSYQIVHARLLADYGRVPARPFVLFESTYEGDHDSTPLQIRRQAWWALTCGAAGQFFGNYPIWLMPPGWESALDTPGATDMAHLRAFIDAIRWWELVPDRDRTFLVAGAGSDTDLDRATASVAPDGSQAVVYVPSPRTLALDLAHLGGWATAVRWFQPSTGIWSTGGLVARRGHLQLTTPGDGDWALVLDDPGYGRHRRWSAG
jgi:hypothetical protein